MKNLLVIAMLTGIFFLAACGQKSEVPQAVKTAFNQKFSMPLKLGGIKKKLMNGKLSSK